MQLSCCLYNANAKFVAPGKSTFGIFYLVLEYLKTLLQRKLAKECWYSLKCGFNGNKKKLYFCGIWDYSIHQARYFLMKWSGVAVRPWSAVTITWSNFCILIMFQLLSRVWYWWPQQIICDRFCAFLSAHNSKMDLDSFYFIFIFSENSIGVPCDGLLWYGLCGQVSAPSIFLPRFVELFCLSWFPVFLFIGVCYLKQFVGHLSLLLAFIAGVMVNIPFSVSSSQYPLTQFPP